MKYLAIIFLFCFSFSPVFLYSQSTESVNKEKNIESDGKREEIQRYFGYETLLFRYLTLPYDANINTNQQGRFVDVGFLLIILLPVVLLGLLFKDKRAFYLLSGILLVYIILCMSFSLMLIDRGDVYYANEHNWAEKKVNENLGASDRFLGYIYHISDQIMLPVKRIVENKTKEKDSITYPILFFLILLVYSVITGYKKISFKSRLLSIILLSYSVLWFLLSGGILWYGFLIIPLSLIIIGYYQKVDISNSYISKYFRALCIACFGIWLIFSFVHRISDIESGSRGEPEHLGKSILNGSIFPYSMGIYSTRKTIDFTTPNISLALDKINRDNELIYMIGTSYSFNIKNNIERIFQDNLLTNFYVLHQRFPKKDDFVKMLKASGFKYIVVDLHTPSLDNTPEQSLVQKFQLLLQILFDNAYIDLIATDRIVEYTDSGGQIRTTPSMFGTKMVNFGSYAVYEIL